MLRRVAFLRTDVLEGNSASNIRVTRISELGMSECSVLKRYGVRSQKMTFLVITAVKTSNLT
jgi:hypothetical protein